MPPRKRKVPEKTNDEVVEENVVETPKKNDKNVDRKTKGQKKQKSNEIETDTSPQVTEKHVVVKILMDAQTNEAFHSKYIKELTNQYAKVTVLSIQRNEFVVYFCLFITDWTRYIFDNVYSLFKTTDRKRGSSRFVRKCRSAIYVQICGVTHERDLG